MKINFSQRNDTLTLIPPINGRYIVLDTETTGLEPKENNIIEIAGIEIINGKLTGNQFHCFLKPRFKILKSAEEKHKMSQNFYEDYYQDCYKSDKENLLNLIKFIGNSLIFAHNSIFDMKFLNKELQYYNISPIPRRRFRCTMKIFKQIIKPNSLKQNYSLYHCCKFFNLSAPIENFHSAIFDSFMTARVLCCLFQWQKNKIEKEYYKLLSYNLRKSDYINEVDNYLNYYNNNLFSLRSESLSEFNNAGYQLIYEKQNNINCNSTTEDSGEFKNEIKNRNINFMESFHENKIINASFDEI